MTLTFLEDGDGARGYRFVVRRLRELDDPVRDSEKVVRRIMREEGLVPRWMRRRAGAYSSYGGEVTPAPPNLVRRDFRSALPNVSVNLFFTSFAKQAHRSRKVGFTGCANVFSPIPVTA